MTLSWTDYLTAEGVNWSTLAEMRKSPKHYLHRLRNPMPDTKSTILGRATHAAVFERFRFEHDFVPWTGKVRRGKKWDAFKAEQEHLGRTIITQADWDAAEAIAAAVEAHPEASQLITGGVSEKSIFWTDPVTGLRCKARLDYLRPDRIVDLKTTRDAATYRFTRDAHNYGYHCQFAHGREGCNHNGAGMLPVSLIVVENAPPYDVAVFDYDEDALYAGAEEVAGLLLRVKQCQDSGQWPGRYADRQILRLPAWAYDSEDDDVGDELIIGSDSDE